MIAEVLLALVPVLLVVVIFVVGFSWYMAHSSLRPVQTAKKQTPADVHLPFEDFTVEHDGVVLRGWFVPAADAHLSNGARLPTIIVTHGWGRSAERMLPHAKYLHAAGFHVVLYDLRGHGDSSAVDLVTMVEIVKDLQAVLDHTLARPEVDGNRVGLLGHSMGAAASVIAASRNPAVKAVVSSSGFADFGDLTAQMLRWRKLPAVPFRFLVRKFWESRTKMSITEVNPRQQIGKIRAPVLLLHGDRDEVVTPDQLQKLFEGAQAAETHLVSGGTHSNLVENAEYRARVLGFLQKALNRHTPGAA